MMSIKTMLAALVVAFLGTASPIWAQGYPLNPVSRPAVSPYINILRQGASPGVNYYGIVRPELQFRGAIAQNQLDIAGNQQAISNLNPGAITTGHHAGFMTQWRYFMNTGTGATSSFRRSLMSQGSTSSSLANVSRR